MYNDALGSRMKDQYEHRTRYLLPRRTYTIIRLDGKAFHTFTRNMRKPFDDELSCSLDAATIALCGEAMGCQLAYLQSDEISLLLTDFATESTQAWFDGNVQKLASVSASILTREFCAYLARREESGASFDARVFTIPDPVEVANYFIWRQKDWIRNSVQMLAQALYSHKELQNKNTSDLIAMCLTKGHDWHAYGPTLRFGRVIHKVSYVAAPLSAGQYEVGQQIDIENAPQRTKWEVAPAWDFTDPAYPLTIPTPGYRRV